ncbi:MAG: hypothetical protein BAJALOKI1v1_220023 [Promethearchaeota archaeon]|nr:MAG: hypothetical protein BAJALOKI1v1_220023 [Candidatus Lokiarchaeota archaeon]
MEYVDPSFEIDSDGRVLCRAHSNYDFFLELECQENSARCLDRELTCKTCEHYYNDDCYFSKEIIDQVETNRLKKKKKFICKLCGNKIDRMLTILYSLYFKDKYNVKIPLICCACHAALKEDKFEESSKYRSNIFLYNALYAVYSLISVIFFIFVYQIGFFYLLIFLVPIAYLFIINMKKRKNIKAGLQFYKENFLEYYDEKSNNSHEI